MKKYFFILPGILTVALFSCCSDDRQKRQSVNNVTFDNHIDSNYHKKKFDSLIQAIDKHIGLSLDNSEELLSDPNFMEIYNHGTMYLENIVEFLSKDSLSGWHPYLCILAMQNLSTVDYVKFCNIYVDLYEKAKINEGLLQDALTPNFLKKRIIPKNYTNPDVIKLLNRILNDEKISKEFRERIKTILSGKYIKDIESFFDLLYYFEIAKYQFIKDIYLRFVIACGIYCLINLARIFLRTRKYLLIIELVANIFFSMYFGFRHEYLFLIMTIISSFFIFFPKLSRNHA